MNIKNTKTVWNKPKKENRLKHDELVLFKIFINDKANFGCQICHKNNIEEFHHLFFGSYGADKDDRTLIGVCRECHEWCHSNKHQSQRDYKKVADLNWLEFTEM